jgi:hypothetical protein
MLWFRRNRRRGSFGALLALALQLALSFGHVHPDHPALGRTAAAAAQSEADRGTSGNVPDRDEGCAICAIIGLSSSVLIPDPPAVAFAGAQLQAFFSDVSAPLVSNPVRAQFQARAPPA